MPRSVSVRDLRNNTAEVVAAVQTGETLTLTVNRTPVADIVPHVERRSPWVPAAVLRRMLAEAPADPGLMRDIAEVRSALVDDPR
jgi:prevent-host-death family protein